MPLTVTVFRLPRDAGVLSDLAQDVWGLIEEEFTSVHNVTAPRVPGPADTQMTDDVVVRVRRDRETVLDLARMTQRELQHSQGSTLEGLRALRRAIEFIAFMDQICGPPAVNGYEQLSLDLLDLLCECVQDHFQFEVGPQGDMARYFFGGYTLGGGDGVRILRGEDEFPEALSALYEDAYRSPAPESRKAEFRAAAKYLLDSTPPLLTWAASYSDA